jgi:hypothetical protein
MEKIMTRPLGTSAVVISLVLVSYFAAGTATAQNVTPTSWWSADTGFNDVLGNNAGTRIGGVALIPDGQSGQAFQFDGGGYVVIANNSGTLSPTSQIMIAAWIRPNFAVSNIVDSILSKRDGCGNRSYELAVHMAGSGLPAGTVMFATSLGTDLYSNVPIPNDGHFHEVAGSYDGATMRIFLDGALVGFKPHSGPIEVTAEAPAIGAQVGCGQFAYADIDEIRVFSDAGFARTGANTFNGNQTVIGTVSAAAILGDGSGLTNLSPTSINSGTATINISGTAATAVNSLNSANLNGVPGNKYARLDVDNMLAGNQSIAGTLAIGAGTVIRQHLSFTISLAVPQIGPAACAPVRAFVFANTVSDGDTLALGIANSLISPSTAGSGILDYTAWANGPGIMLRVCNINPNGPKSKPVSGTLRVDVWKH